MTDGNDERESEREHTQENTQEDTQERAGTGRRTRSLPDRAVGVTGEVYDGLIWLADNRAEVDALDHRYPESPDATATVLYENNHDGAAAWVTANPNKYRRGRLEGFYEQRAADDPDASLDHTTDAPPDTPDVTDRPSPRSDLLAEFLNVPEEWHATAAGFAIGYAIYTPDPTLVAFALTLVGLDAASTVAWEGNDKLIREMRAEYQYAIFGAVMGVGLGLVHLSMTGGDAAIAGTVTDIAESAVATAGLTGPYTFWMAIFTAIFGAAVLGTILLMVTLRLVGLVP